MGEELAGGEVVPDRNIPVVLINGRLSAHSFRGYRLLAPITRRMFGRLTMACVQDDAYAGRFSRVGVPADRIRVTGTMKFDTASVADSVDGAADIAASVRLRPGEEKIWVCGSTGPGEEKIAIGVYARLRKKFPRLRLVLVPRHPERFDEVANLIRSAGFDAIRRSVARADLRAASTARADAIVLGDTMGELRKFYSMADAVFVGRSLVDLGAKQHGSDMIEAAALAKPVIVGRHTGNFADVMDRFREAGAIREVADAEGLETEVEGLLTSPLDAADLGRRGQEVVSQNQGATQRHVGVILEYLRRSQDR
jgi:3-deoxy-D-manno-octulosonic-acid transferase